MSGCPHQQSVSDKKHLCDSSCRALQLVSSQNSISQFFTKLKIAAVSTRSFLFVMTRSGRMEIMMKQFKDSCTMKFFLKFMAILLVAVIALSTVSCSNLMPSREIKLINDTVYPKVFKVVYEEKNEDGISPCFSFTVDEKENMLYTESNHTELSYIKKENGRYTASGRRNNESVFAMDTLVADAELSFHLFVKKYSLHTFYGKSKKLKDVEYVGRDCYAFKITIKDSAGKSWTNTTVKEVYIDKETGMLLREIILDYDDPTGTTSETIGSGIYCTEFTTTPELIVPVQE